MKGDYQAGNGNLPKYCSLLGNPKNVGSPSFIDEVGACFNSSCPTYASCLTRKKAKEAIEASRKLAQE